MVRKTYTITINSKYKVGCDTNMSDCIRNAIQILEDHELKKNQVYVEVEVTDNLTELTVFKEKKIKSVNKKEEIYVYE